MLDTTRQILCAAVAVLTAAASSQAGFVRTWGGSGATVPGKVALDESGNAYVELQATDDLGSTFTNMPGTAVTGPNVFDASNRKTYTNEVRGTKGFIRAVIH